jgi:hypothetical protein
MKMNLVSGTAIAAAAVALAVGGISLSTSGAKAADVQCVGGNSCKGQSACKGAGHDCKGQNACKGKGFVTAKSADDCKKLGGQPG